MNNKSSIYDYLTYMDFCLSLQVYPLIILNIQKVAFMGKVLEKNSLYSHHVHFVFTSNLSDKENFQRHME